VLPILLLSAALLQAGPAVAVDRGTLQGIVRAQGSLEPLPHAVVRISDLNRAAQADAKGFFVIADIPSGRWRAEASAIGYDAHALTILVSGGTVRIDFELIVRPVPMPVLEVRASLTGETETAAAPLPQAGPASVRVHSRALRTIPGLVEPDVLRALQTLPSVAAMSDFSSALYVRGGAADQSVVTLDGIPLFNPYHVGGLFSAIPIDAVSSVDLWAGAMPARAPDRLSGGVQVHTRDGGRDRSRASGGVGLLSSSLTLDGPLAGGSYLVSARRTYLNAVTDAAYALGLTDGTVPYGFSDAYGKVTLPVGALGAISLSTYLNSESLSFPERMRQSMGAGPTFDWGSAMTALNYRQPIGQSLLLEARLGYSGFSGNFDAWQTNDEMQYVCDGIGNCHVVQLPRDSTHVLSARTVNRDVVVGAGVTWYHARHTVRAGSQIDGYVFDHTVAQLDDVDSIFAQPFSRYQTLRTAAFHVEDEWQATDRIMARVGMRALLAGELGSALLPRLGVHLQLTPRLSLAAGGGAYAQALRSMRNDESVVSSFVAYDLIDAQPSDAGLARGTDAVVGLSFADINTAVRADVYVKRTRGLALPPHSRDPLRAPVLVVDDYRIGSGRSRGLELSAQHRHRAAELGVAYTLSFADLDVGGERYTARHERRHFVDANAVMNWGARGLLSSRIMFGSGQPHTPVVGVQQVQIYDAALDRWEWAVPRLILGEHNSARLPGYLRVDVAARREFSPRWFGRQVEFTPYVQILNVLNSRNVLISDPVLPGIPQLRYYPQLPFLPTFGFEWRH
jgi:hypothetical protein